MGTLSGMAKGLLLLSAGVMFALAPRRVPEAVVPPSSRVVVVEDEPVTRVVERVAADAGVEVLPRSGSVGSDSVGVEPGVGGTGPSDAGVVASLASDAGDTSVVELQAVRQQLAQSQAQLESLNAYARALESQVASASQAQQQDRVARSTRSASLTQAVNALESAQITLNMREDPTAHFENAAAWLADVTGPEADAARKLTAFALEALAREDGYAAMMSAQQAAEAINNAAQAGSFR